MQTWAQLKDRNGMDLTEAEDTKTMATIHKRTIQKEVLMTWIATMV